MPQPTDRVALESTLLAWAFYQPTRLQLELEFRSGKRYLYFGFPEPTYQQFLRSPSKGAFFNAHIRNCFPFRDLSHPSAPIILVSAETK